MEFYESPEYGLTVFNAIDLPSSTNAYPEYLTAIDCRPSAHHERDNLVAEERAVLFGYPNDYQHIGRGKFIFEIQT